MPVDGPIPTKADTLALYTAAAKWALEGDSTVQTVRTWPPLYMGHLVLRLGLIKGEGTEYRVMGRQDQRAMAIFIAATSSSESAGGFSQNVGFFRSAAITYSRWTRVGVTITTASTSASSISAIESV